MLRFAIALLAAVAACGTAESADGRSPILACIAPRSDCRRACRGRTTFQNHDHLCRAIHLPPPLAAAFGLRGAGLLYAPVVYVEPLLVAPTRRSDVPYWDRLPYACGVFGYC